MAGNKNSNGHFLTYQDYQDYQDYVENLCLDNRGGGYIMPVLLQQ